MNVCERQFYKKDKIVQEYLNMKCNTLATEILFSPPTDINQKTLFMNANRLYLGAES